VSALGFKLDENVARDVAVLLREHGYDVRTVHEEQLAGEPDSVVIAACQREVRILLTLDLHFADVRQYPPWETPGIIVLRLATQTIAAELALAGELVRFLSDRSPARQLWIAEPGRVRIRG
jgi:hypothetical protein